MLHISKEDREPGENSEKKDPNDRSDRLLLCVEYGSTEKEGKRWQAYETEIVNEILWKYIRKL